MAKSKQSGSRLKDIIANHEYVSVKCNEVSYYHNVNGRWCQYCISGLGIEYKSVEINEIPNTAIVVDQGFFQKQTKEITNLMQERIEWCRELEKEVSKNT